MEIWGKGGGDYGAQEAGEFGMYVQKNVGQ